MNLLFYLVLPIATIIFVVALQKLFKNPILVASIIFAIYFILAFTTFADNSTFLLNVILYTVLAYITAYLTGLICKVGNFSLSNLNVGTVNAQNLRSQSSSSNRISTETLSTNRIIRNDNDESTCGCLNNRNYNRLRFR